MTVRWAREDDPRPRLRIVDLFAPKRSSLISPRLLGTFLLDPNIKIANPGGILCLYRPPRSILHGMHSAYAMHAPTKKTTKNIGPIYHRRHYRYLSFKSDSSKRFFKTLYKNRSKMTYNSHHNYGRFSPLPVDWLHIETI